MPKKFVAIGIALLVVAIVFIAFFGIWVGLELTGGSGSVSASPYSAVYLSNGSMYFGILAWLPKPHLTNVWLLQSGVDEKNQQQLGVAQFSKAFWGPMDELNLNPKEIVWWAKLRTDSQLAQAMANPSMVQQQAQQQQQQVLPPAPAGASPKSPAIQQPAK